MNRYLSEILVTLKFTFVISRFVVKQTKLLGVGFRFSHGEPFINCKVRKGGGVMFTAVICTKSTKVTRGSVNGRQALSRHSNQVCLSVCLSVLFCWHAGMIGSRPDPDTCIAQGQAVHGLGLEWRLFCFFALSRITGLSVNQWLSLHGL